MTVKILLTEPQQDLVDQIYLKDNEIALLNTRIKLLGAESKELKADLLARLQEKAEYKTANKDDNIELTGKTQVIYLTRDVRKRVINYSEIIARLTKVKMLEVFNISLKKLQRKYPKLFEAYIQQRHSGNRRFTIIKDDSDADTTANDDNME